MKKGNGISSSEQLKGAISSAVSGVVSGATAALMRTGRLSNVIAEKSSESSGSSLKFQIDVFKNKDLTLGI